LSFVYVDLLTVDIQLRHSWAVLALQLIFFTSWNFLWQNQSSTL